MAFRMKGFNPGKGTGGAFKQRTIGIKPFTGFNREEDEDANLTRDVGKYGGMGIAKYGWDKSVEAIEKNKEIKETQKELGIVTGYGPMEWLGGGGSAKFFSKVGGIIKNPKKIIQGGKNLIQRGKQFFSKGGKKTTQPIKTEYSTSGHLREAPHYGGISTNNAFDPKTREIARNQIVKSIKIDDAYRANPWKITDVKIQKVVDPTGSHQLARIVLPNGTSQLMIQSSGGGKKLMLRGGKWVSSKGYWYPHFGHGNVMGGHKNWVLKTPGQQQGWKYTQGWDSAYGSKYLTSKQVQNALNTSIK